MTAAGLKAVRGGETKLPPGETKLEYGSTKSSSVCNSKFDREEAQNMKKLRVRNVRSSQ